MATKPELPQPPAYTFTKESDGTDTIKVLPAHLPAPADTFFANAAWANGRGEDVELAFGQLTFKAAIAGCLVVSLPLQALRDSLPASFRESLHAHRAERGWRRAEGETPTPGLPAERMFLVRANIATVAFWNDDTELRFYRMSSADYQLVKTGGDAPFVYLSAGVTLPTALFGKLVDQLELRGSL